MTPKIRKGQPSTVLSKADYEKRWRQQFPDQAFANVTEELKSVFEASWTFYETQKKYVESAPIGTGYQNPEFQAPVAWLRTKKKMEDAQFRNRDLTQRKRILVVCASSRNEHTCPSEVSKSSRLAKRAQELVERSGLECSLIDLSEMTAEYGKMIYPCKACVSTAMPLCHWPCSCYPNETLGQVNDWMEDIYPEWVAAHGIFVITPVYWYQVPSSLKLMLDRLVCADGGNPDLSSTDGKDPKLAKEIELKGWDFPRHLEGRAFSLFVHGDTDGVTAVKQSLISFFLDLKLVLADPMAQLSRYIGYMKPYATSHDDLDAEDAIFKEVEVCAQALCDFVCKDGGNRGVNQTLQDPRPK